MYFLPTWRKLVRPIPHDRNFVAHHLSVLGGCGDWFRSVRMATPTMVRYGRHRGFFGVGSSKTKLLQWGSNNNSFCVNAFFFFEYFGFIKKMRI